MSLGSPVLSEDECVSAHGFRHLLLLGARDAGRAKVTRLAPKPTILHIAVLHQRGFLDPRRRWTGPKSGDPCNEAFPSVSRGARLPLRFSYPISHVELSRPHKYLLAEANKLPTAGDRLRGTPAWTYATTYASSAATGF